MKLHEFCHLTSPAMTKSAPPPNSPTRGFEQESDHVSDQQVLAILVAASDESLARSGNR
jgi:hypothetical protein